VLPVFVIVSFFVDDVPVFTLAERQLEPLNESVCDTATPVPLNATVVGNWRITHDTRRAGQTSRCRRSKHCIEMLHSLRCKRGRTESVHCVAVPVALTCEIVREAVPES